MLSQYAVNFFNYLLIYAFVDSFLGLINYLQLIYIIKLDLHPPSNNILIKWNS